MRWLLCPGVGQAVGPWPPYARADLRYSRDAPEPNGSNHLLVDLRRYTSGTHPNRKHPTQPSPTNACHPAKPTQLTPTNATNAAQHALRRRWRRFESCRGHTLEGPELLGYSDLVKLPQDRLRYTRVHKNPEHRQS